MEGIEDEDLREMRQGYLMEIKLNIPVSIGDEETRSKSPW
jgi:hypothetical protein